jgi:cysteine desulfuration protein SufE
LPELPQKMPIDYLESPMQHDDFSSIDLNLLIDTKSWQEKYRLILQWSELITPKPALQKPETILKGCEVDSWIKTESTHDAQYFLFDSQSKLIKGLAAIILVQLNGKPQEFIRTWNGEEFLQKIQLQKHMTPSRNNGLLALIGFCKGS